MSTTYSANLILGIPLQLLSTREEERTRILKRFDSKTGKPIDVPQKYKVCFVNGVEFEGSLGDVLKRSFGPAPDEDDEDADYDNAFADPWVHTAYDIGYSAKNGRMSEVVKSTIIGCHLGSSYDHDNYTAVPHFADKHALVKQMLKETLNYEGDENIKLYLMVRTG